MFVPSLLCKPMLSSGLGVARYNPEHPLHLVCDTSQYGVGTVLSHVYDDGSERFIAFPSRTLTDAVKQWSA